MRPFLIVLIIQSLAGSARSSWLEETFNDVWQQIEVVKSDLHSLAVNTANLEQGSKAANSRSIHSHKRKYFFFGLKLDGHKP